jgi:hypothetical protein
MKREPRYVIERKIGVLFKLVKIEEVELKNV